VTPPPLAAKRTLRSALRDRFAEGAPELGVASISTPPSTGLPTPGHLNADSHCMFEPGGSPAKTVAARSFLDGIYRFPVVVLSFVHNSQMVRLAASRPARPVDLNVVGPGS
jgi:hypothetical protein